MRSKLLRANFALFTVMLAILFGAATVSGQVSSFTYQGRLTDGGTAATGNYDLQFALWDSASGGTQIGSPQTINTVAVTGGVFTVSLDFGAASFNGANRFLEISARPTGAGSFTLLSPRQPVTATPYAVHSANASSADALSNGCAGCVQDPQINSINGSKVLGTVPNATNAANATNSAQLGGVAASQYVQTGDPRLTDARPPTPGSANYLQTNPSSAQSANFNISGNGTAGATLSAKVVNTATGYNIGGLPVLSVTGGAGSFANSNTFAGVGAGAATTPSSAAEAGNLNTFFGQNAGLKNTSGFSNAFFGYGAGFNNTASKENSFFGTNAGVNTTFGGGNSFFGDSAGSGNTTGIDNAFFGSSAGGANSTGKENSAIGLAAAESNRTGNNNTYLGAFSDSSDALQNATAVGSLSFVTQSNSLVLGSIKGQGRGTADTNVGIGTTAPQAKLHVAGDARVDGNITLFSLGTATSTQATLCRNTSSQIAFCNSSSLRYKTNIMNFAGGMNIINHLRPISFTWKADGVKDIGFGAEEVEKIAPAFTFRNDKGQIEGVRYDRLGVLFVNAFKEQQAQIQKQQAEITKQRAQIKQQQASAAQQQAEIASLNARLRTLEQSMRKKPNLRRRHG